MVVRPIAKLDEEARRNNDLVTELRCLRRRNGQLHSAGINSRTDSIPVRRPVVPRVPRQKQSSSVEAHCNTRRAHRGAARAIATPPTRNSHMISRSSPQAAVDHNCRCRTGRETSLFRGGPRPIPPPTAERIRDWLASSRANALGPGGIAWGRLPDGLAAVLSRGGAGP